MSANGNGVSPQVKKYVVEITPAMAAAWLAQNNGRNYRRLSKDTARIYANLMRDGKWEEEHPDGIQFDWDGNLGNGQHRLYAIVLYDKPVRMFVEEGHNPVKFFVTDKHRVRTTADDIQALGFNAPTKAVADRAAAIARRMVIGLRSNAVFRGDQGLVSRVAMDHRDVILSMVSALAGAKPYRAEVAAAFCKASFEFDREQGRVAVEAKRFADRVFTGKEDPLNRLYERLVTASGATGGNAQSEIYGLAVSAVRAALEGRTFRALYVTTQDFVGPWEDGYSPPARREQARRGWETRRHALQADLLNSAEDVYRQAKAAGVRFALSESGEVRAKYPPQTSPNLMAQIKAVREGLPFVVTEDGPLVGAALV